MLIRVALLLVAAVVVVVGWPRAVGGAASYVVVSGSSMEPTLKSGDLVITRRASSYDVGDVVAFRTAEGDVIHRIIGGDAESGFRTQGDNVERADPYLPTPRDIHGRQLVRVPKLGGWGLRLTGIVPAPVLGGAAVLLAIGGERRRRRRRRIRRRGTTTDHTPTPSDEEPVTTSLFSRSRVQAAAACVVAAVVVLPSAFVAWRTPTTVPAAEDTTGVSHVLETTVTGLVDQPTRLYEDGRTEPITADQAGEVPEDAQPLLRSLVDRVEVTASYHADGEAVNGTGQLDLVLVTGRGFRLPYASLEPTTFAGSWEATTTVDLDRVDRELQRYLEEAGLSRDTIAVHAVPTVVTDGGAVLRGEPTVLTPGDEVVTVEGTLRTVTDPAGAADGTTEVAATAPLVGIPMPVWGARVLATALLAGLLVAAVLLLRREEQDAPQLRMDLLYGSLLVEIEPDASVGGEIVRVASMAELARLARRDHRSILHQQRPDGRHRYLVPDGDLTYEYVVGTRDERTTPVPDDASGLDADLPRSPAELPAEGPVVVEDFAELSRLWLRASDAPGRLERRRRADGGIRFAVTRDGREFVYDAEPGEDVVGGARA